MLDLGADSPWHGTPAARLHAAIWLMGRSPLMFAGALPADAQTLNLVANPLGLAIHAASSSLRAAYQGDCSCTPNSRAEFACTLRDAAGAPPCVAVWHASLPGAPTCRALALLNLGAVAAPAVHVSWSDIGLPSAPPRPGLNVTDVFGGNSSVLEGVGFVSSVAAHGAVLLVVSEASAEACVPPAASAEPARPPRSTAASAEAEPGPLAPAQLRVEYMDAPHGVDVAAPRFSWEAQHTDRRQAQWRATPCNPS